MKTVFMGTPYYATTIFKAIYKEFNIVSIFTQPDKPVGRKKILTPPHIKKFCIDNSINIPIYQPDSLKNTEIINVIKDINPDFIIVAAYGQILPKEILEIAPAINLHASILPKYRGASPIQDIFLNGEEFTGVTAMLMEEGLDSGDILSTQYIKIQKDDNVETIFDKLSIVAADLTINTLRNFDNIKPLKQNRADATFCKKIKKDDGIIKFENAEKIYQKYLAYKNWPEIFLENGLKLKNIAINELNSENSQGEILEIHKDKIIVGCKKGSIIVFKVQPKSKKEMDIGSYIRGRRLNIADNLS